MMLLLWCTAGQDSFNKLNMIPCSLRRVCLQLGSKIQTAFRTLPFPPCAQKGSQRRLFHNPCSSLRSPTRAEDSYRHDQPFAIQSRAEDEPKAAVSLRLHQVCVDQVWVGQFWLAGCALLFAFCSSCWQ